MSLWSRAKKGVSHTYHKTRRYVDKGAKALDNATGKTGSKVVKEGTKGIENTFKLGGSAGKSAIKATVGKNSITDMISRGLDDLSGGAGTKASNWLKNKGSNLIDPLGDVGSNVNKMLRNDGSADMPIDMQSSDDTGGASLNFNKNSKNSKIQAKKKRKNLKTVKTNNSFNF